MLWVLGSVLIMLALALVGIGYFFQDELVGIFTKEINKQLTAEVSVDEIKFSAWKKFPDATVEFQNISCLEAKSFPRKDTLFTAESLFLNFNLWDLIQGRYKVKQIELSAGKLNLVTDSRGNKNYSIWKTSENPENSNFQIDLESILLSGIDFQFANQVSRQEYSAIVENARVSGSLKSGVMQYKSNAKLKDFRAKHPHFQILDPIPLDLDLEMVLEGEKITIRESEIRWNQTRLIAEGEIQGDDFNLLVSGSSLKLEETLPFLPENIREALTQYHPKGKIALSGRVIGNKSGLKAEGSFSAERAEILRKDAGLSLSNMEFSGDFNYPGNSRQARIRINDFEGNLNKGKIKGKLDYENFNSPKIDLQVSANLDWAYLLPFVGIPEIESASGAFDSEIRFRGQFASAGKIRGSDLGNAEFSGFLNTQPARIKLQGNSNPYEISATKLVFDNQEVGINNLQAKIGQSDFTLNGTCKNLLDYLLVPGRSLLVQADLKAGNLDFNEILSSNARVEKKEESYALRISPRLTAQVNLEIGALKFRRFEARNLRGKMDLRDQIMRIDPLYMETLDGKIQGNFVLNGRGNRLHLTGRSDLENIDVQDLFYACENFGQAYLRSDHLRGLATASIVWDTYWSEGLEPDLDKFNAVGDIQIDQGELINFEPMKALADYVRLEELEHIKFQTLQNQITIRNQKVIIPKMDIKSSALTVEASGIHGFDNSIDYKFRLLLQELLTRKVRNQDPELFEEHGVIRKEGLETSLYLTMVGTVDDFTIKYDRQGLKEKIKDEIQAEKKEVITLIRDEFKGEQKPDTSKTTPIKESGFTFEWDEDDENPKDP